MWNAIQAYLITLPGAFLNSSLLLTALWLVLGFAERKFPLHPSKPQRKDWRLDFVYFYLGTAIPALVLILVVKILVMLFHALGPMPWHAWVAQLPTQVAFVAAVVLSEVAYYWVHRIAHQVPFFWRFHAVHHSSPHMYWMCAARTHPLDLSFFRAFIFVSLYVLGFAHGAWDHSFTVYGLCVAVWSYYMHSNIRLRLGWLEYVIATPAFHHWHHVKGDPALVDKNYCANFPFMDLLFGTFYLPRKEWPKQYGIDDALAPGLWGQLIDPLRGRSVRQIGPTAWKRKPLQSQPQP